MSTDKLEALSNTVAEILSKPPSPPTYFDEEADDTAEAGEQIAKVSDNLRLSTEIPKENVGRPTSRKFGISPNENFEADIGRAAGRESVDIARQALADQITAVPQGDTGNQLLKQLSELSQETANLRSESHATSRNRFGKADPGNRTPVGGWMLRGFAVILLAAGIGAAAVIWLGSPGDAAKTAPSQRAALAQSAPTAAPSPELMPLLQSMARDLTGVGKEIEQLKASQEQLNGGAARLSEQLKASQEQVARDNANVAEQIKTIQDQLARINAPASEKNAPPEIATAPIRPTLPRPRPTVSAVRKPVPTLTSPLATAKPKPEKPKLSSASQPPAPAR
jgi:hypothetical protein